jgi:hypothetical protein
MQVELLVTRDQSAIMRAELSEGTSEKSAARREHSYSAGEFFLWWTD